MILFDIESKENEFVLSFKELNSTNIKTISLKNDDKIFGDNRTTVLTYIKNNTLIGFNTDNYNIPVLLYSLQNTTCKDIFKMQDVVIQQNLMQWETIDKFCLIIPSCLKSINLSKVASGGSLELISAKLNYTKSLKVVNNLELQSINQLYQLENLYNYCVDSLNFRKYLEKIYSINFMSSSNSQIVEKLIRKELKIIKPIRRENNFNYFVPDYLDLTTNTAIDLATNLENTKFTIENNIIQLPDNLKNYNFKLAGYDCTLGLGGIQSSEQYLSYNCLNDETIVTCDVVSFYPNIIVNNKINPQVGFLDFYKSLLNQRLEAKNNKDENLSKLLKILINISFGKLGYKYSTLYYPHGYFDVVLTGQLILIELIQQLDNVGIKILSFHTDSITVVIKNSQKSEFNNIAKNWCNKALLKLEYDYYTNFYAINLNNYFMYDKHTILTNKDFKTKRRGLFQKSGLYKNPNQDIIYEAIMNYFKKGIAIDFTILSCQDYNKFLTIRTKNENEVYRMINSIEGVDYSDDEFIAKVDFVNNLESFDWVNKIDYTEYFKLADKIIESFKHARA